MSDLSKIIIGSIIYEKERFDHERWMLQEDKFRLKRGNRMIASFQTFKSMDFTIENYSTTLTLTPFGASVRLRPLVVALIFITTPFWFFMVV